VHFEIVKNSSELSEWVQNVNISILCFVLLMLLLYFSILFLMQLWKSEFELDGINSGSSYHCLPVWLDILLSMRGRLYSSCVRSSMLHGSET